MIDITDQIIGIAREIVGNAYRAWPQKAPKGPYAIIDWAGRSVEQVDADGSEVIVRLTYTIGVLAPKPSQASDLLAEVVDRMALYNFHTVGMTSVYEDPSKLYRANATIDGAVDRRGATFL